MTSILRLCPSTQTPTLSPVYTQTVHFMKCSQGNGYLYGSNSERLSLSEITGKDSWISFGDVRTDIIHIPFTLLFFYVTQDLCSFRTTLRIFMALQKSQLQLYYQQS